MDGVIRREMLSRPEARQPDHIGMLLSLLLLVLHQINTHPPQRLHRPTRILLLPLIQPPKELPHKRRVPILQNRLPYLPHQIQLIVHIMHRQQMRAHRLLRRCVVDIRPSDAQTALFGGAAHDALAPGLDGAKVFRVGSVAQVFDAGGGDGVAEALLMSVSSLTTREERNWKTHRRPRRPNTIKHIRPQRHTNHQILRIPHAHNIPRLLLRQQSRHRIHNLTITIFLLSTTEPPNGDTRGVPRDHLGSAFTPEVKVEAALDDAEEVLAVGVLVGFYAAVEPADGAVHGFGHAGEVGGGRGDDVVELHYYV